LQALGSKPSEDIIGLKQKIITGSSKISSFQEKTLEVPLKPFGLFKPDVKVNKAPYL
jgi:hypothetical protein